MTDLSRTPFTPVQLQMLARQHGTPLWVYDAATVLRRIQDLQAFDTVRFAQKANSNIHLLRLMRQQGVAVDAVSPGEIQRALAAGYTAAQDARGGAHGIVFTADVLTSDTLALVLGHGIPVNTGSVDMIHQLGRAAPGSQHPVWLRINPGFGHGHSNKTNTGGEHSKHGIWHTEVPVALAAIREHGLQLYGLHMHIGSGVDYGHLEQVCLSMVDLIKATGADVQAISAGGGLSIPYRPGGDRIDTAHYFGLWDAARQAVAAHLGHAVHLEIEPGRYLVAEAGVLLAEVRATKWQGSQHFTLVDAGFSDLMRPAMYGAHHEMSIVPAQGDDHARPTRPTVVAGPLCESGDVFTQAEGGVVLTRDLPAAQVGDLLVIHDAGAYGASMSSNYNSRPLAAEVLVDADGTSRVIRRRQSLDELLALEV
ncbi:MAG TPA: diaminopimelate decarboxylase [Burkholderiaceae bacterium]|nr:diaminopimelate decarboxylase [Burkholderiaceae bacterium]